MVVDRLTYILAVLITGSLPAIIRCAEVIWLVNRLVASPFSNLRGQAIAADRMWLSGDRMVRIRPCETRYLD